MTSTEVLHAQSISVDGWTCWDAVDPPIESMNNIWIWEDIKGWFGDLPVRAGPIERPMLDGDYDGPAPFGGRTIEISGTLISPDRLSLQYGMDEIARVLAGTTRRAVLTVDEAQRDVKRQAVVRLGAPTMVARTGPHSAEWSLSLYASDPLRYSETQHMVKIERQAVSTGRTYNMTHDRIYGAAGSGGTATIFNAGNAPTAPMIHIGQNVANPTVGVVDGDKLQVMMTTYSADRIEMDCHARTVMYFDDYDAVGVSRRYLLTTASRWLIFPPGFTEVYYTVATGGGYAYIYWRDAWI